jgi:hypothetical protein
VLDEALATTDEARFAAIADAVLRLVDDGWQVIYMTSQRSDLARWSQAANGSAQYHAIELDRVRRLAGAAKDVDELLVPAPRALPAPGAMSAEQYGLAIGVPPFDLEQDLGSVHVFHLLRDDLEFVHELVRLNVERVGVAESLAKAGGRAIGIIDAVRREKLLARIELLRAFTQRWRVGRGRAIDREALQQANVTDVFLERMLKLAAQRGNDPALLLEALANGGLSGFGRGKTEALTEQLQLALFLDTTPRAPLEDIQWRTAQDVPQVAPREAAALIHQWWQAAERTWSARRAQSETTADV